MLYVVYNMSRNNRIVEFKQSKTYFKTEAAAKAAVTRASKKYQKQAGSEYRNGRRYEEYRLDKDPQFIYGVASMEYYHENLRTMVERVNLMSGETYLEDVNTPNHCSPASESYWSM